MIRALRRRDTTSFKNQRMPVHYWNDDCTLSSSVREMLDRKVASGNWQAGVSWNVKDRWGRFTRSRLPRLEDLFSRLPRSPICLRSADAFLAGCSLGRAETGSRLPVPETRFSRRFGYLFLSVQAWQAVWLEWSLLPDDAVLDAVFGRMEQQHWLSLAARTRWLSGDRLSFGWN